MSAQATQAWLSLSIEQAEHLEQTRLAIDKKHRPSAVCVRDVGYALAWRHGSKGFVDSAVSQIRADLANRYSADQIQRALSCLAQAGLWTVTLKPTQGRKGKKGRAARRVPTFIAVSDPETDPNRLGAYPHTIRPESPGGDDRIAWGSDPNRLGAYPHALKQTPETNPYAETVSEQVRPEPAQSPGGKKEQAMSAAIKLHQDTDPRPVTNPRALERALRADYAPIISELLNRYPQAPVQALAKACLCKHRKEPLSESLVLDLDPVRRDCPVCKGQGHTYRDDETDPHGLRRIMVPCEHTAVA